MRTPIVKDHAPKPKLIILRDNVYTHFNFDVHAQNRAQQWYVYVELHCYVHRPIHPELVFLLFYRLSANRYQSECITIH